MQLKYLFVKSRKRIRRENIKNKVVTNLGEEILEKISFGGLLSLEITRRCNLNCSHCMRGEAQECDMPYTIIDSLLLQTNEIEKILFTGGEPFLALDKMDYFLEKIKSKKIPLYELQIITNGTCFSDESLNIIKNYSDYIERCFEVKYNKKFSEDFKERRITIGISCDRYHNTDSIEIFKQHKEKLRPYAFLFLHTNGELTVKTGRGKNIENAIDDREFYPRRIEVWGKGRTCYCKAVTEYMLKHEPDYSVIMCPIEITATGDVKDFKYGDAFDANSNNIITSLANNISILDEIEKYNEGKLSCIITDKIDKSKISTKIKSYDYRNRLLNLKVSKGDLEKKIKNEIKNYNNSPEYPLEKYYENYGDTLEEISEQLEKYMKNRSYIDVMADYMYGDYSDIYKKYPTLTCEECKKLYGFLKDNDKYMIKKYKLMHYKRAFYNEMMKEVNMINENIIWLNHLKERKEVGMDRLYEMYCAILPQDATPVEKRQFSEAICKIGEDLEFKRTPHIFKLLSKKIKEMAKSFDLSGEQEEPSGKIEDNIYRRIGVLYCCKELISRYRYELSENKQESIRKVNPVIDRMIWIYENLLNYPILIMIAQNNNDLLFKRNKTYSKKEIFEENKRIFSDFNRTCEFLQFKKIYEDFQLQIIEDMNG